MDPLFQGLDLSVGPGEKVVLMGNNGTGKTQLMRILAGEVQPCEGRVVLHHGARTAYLPQDVDLEFPGSIKEFLMQEDVDEFTLLRACHQMGIHSSMLHRRYQTLSLGERIRAAIARLIQEEPTILLLDEPTNNLDREAREWLEGYLQNTRLGVLMVCHDRALVNAVLKDGGRILELDRGKLTPYTGNYDDMVREKRLAQEAAHALYERQKQEEQRLHRVTQKAYQTAETFMKKRKGRDIDPNAKGYYRAKQNALSRRAQGISTRLERQKSETIEKPFDGDGVSVEFGCAPLRYSDALNVRGLWKAFGDRELFGGLNFTLAAGEKIALLGRNGSGKTTLFRILLGELTPDKGAISWSADAKPVFLSQARSQLDPDVPLLQALGLEHEREARALLGRLGLRGETQCRPVRVLSVGERTKAELVKLLLSPANVLLLDEPTNHLDVVSLEAVQEALSEYPGSILFTSHDRAFVEALADHEVWLGPA